MLQFVMNRFFRSQGAINFLRSEVRIITGETSDLADAVEVLQDERTKPANVVIRKFDEVLVRGWRSSRRICFRWLHKCSHQYNHPPSLLVREPIFERWHRPATFGQLIKELAVSNAVHLLRVGEVRRLRIVQRRVVPVAFAGQSVTGRAFVTIDGPNLIEICVSRGNWILQLSRGFGHGPRPALPNRKANSARDDEQQNAKQNLSCSQVFGRRPRHVSEGSLARPEPLRKAGLRAQYQPEIFRVQGENHCGNDPCDHW
jgi:hypothetical protein